MDALLGRPGMGAPGLPGFPVAGGLSVVGGATPQPSQPVVAPPPPSPPVAARGPLTDEPAGSSSLLRHGGGLGMGLIQTDPATGLIKEPGAPTHKVVATVPGAPPPGPPVDLLTFLKQY